jgi:hypothetical protein
MKKDLEKSRSFKFVEKIFIANLKFPTKAFLA